MINENGYRGLTSKDLAYIEEFQGRENIHTIDNINNLKIYEINNKILREIISQNSYTWIHLWRPYCSNNNLQFMEFYSNIKERYDFLNFEFLLISESYDIFSIKKKLKISPYSDLIFVLSNSYYGHKLPEIRSRFIADIVSNSMINPKNSLSDFVFKDTFLLYAGEYLQPEMLDSLISMN
ncbi:MAG: hypothetical protein K0B08_02490 [Bacteroidales bacterium]|nr:hypothetical protein [Bacteroidales bacterium]